MSLYNLTRGTHFIFPHGRAAARPICILPQDTQDSGSSGAISLGHSFEENRHCFQIIVDTSSARKNFFLLFFFLVCPFEGSSTS